MKIKNFLKMKKEKIEFIQNLRRSNASQPHKNKKSYSRKQKHKNNFEE
jgi:stalled ribosome alternative rescue factor ArfA